MYSRDAAPGAAPPAAFPEDSSMDCISLPSDETDGSGRCVLFCGGALAEACADADCDPGARDSEPCGLCGAFPFSMVV